MECPVHKIPLEMDYSPKKYGPHFTCPEVTCSVAKWANSQATPADFKTRQMRITAHDAFDTLWTQPHKRQRMYKELAHFLGLSKKETHIGLLNLTQCKQVIEFAKTRR